MIIQKKAVDLTDLAISVVVLGIIVSIGSYILITYRNSQLTNQDSYTTTNETIAAPTTAGIPLTNTWCKGVTSCLNATDGVAIASGNYSVSISDVSGVCTLTNLTNTFKVGNWKCTYPAYNTSRADYKLANDSAVGLGEYGNWFKIIVIVGITAVILTLIFTAFGRAGSQSESTGTY